MTWASNVGELGVRDVLIEMEAELEGINTALNTPSALPGEVRMFVGEVPEGWAEISPVFPINSPVASPAWLAIPAIENGQSAPWVSTARALCFVGDSKLLTAGATGASSGLSFVGGTTILDITTGEQSTYAPVSMSSPAIFGRTHDKKCFFAGGHRSSSAVPPSSLSATIDEFGVMTATALAPEPLARGASGRLSNDELCVFGLCNGAIGGVQTRKSLKYSTTLNSWTYLPDMPADLPSDAYTAGGVAMHCNGKVLILPCFRTISNLNTFEYDVIAGTYTPAADKVPAGVTSICAASCAHLPTGEAITVATWSTDVLDKYFGSFIYDGVSLYFGPSTSCQHEGGGMFAPTASNLPGDPVITGMNLNDRARTSIGLMLASPSEQYFSQRAIKYARKLP